MTDTPTSDINAFQPCVLEQLVGQRNVISVLRTYLDAYWNDKMAGRDPTLPHMLYCGPSGCGKTQVANVLAKELAVPMTVVTGENLAKSETVYQTLMGLEKDSILFIDEIHSLARYPAAETILLKALAEGKVCLSGGVFQKKPVIVDLPRFVCIGATTDPWSLHPATVSRFTQLQFDFYTIEELAELARQRASAMRLEVEPGVFSAVAQRAKQTPRTCLALLLACHKTARSENSDLIRMDHVVKAMDLLQIDELGLDNLERRYLSILQAAGGPIRLNVIAARLGLPVRTVSRMIESFLVRQELICTTEHGRQLTPKGMDYLKSKGLV
jgi:Holliday junction DNA helicase RuvB